MARHGNALTRVRAKSFLLSCAVGLGAGGVSGWFGEAMSLVGGMVVGLLAVVVAGQAGGFAGMFVRQAGVSLRSGRAGPTVTTDAVQLVAGFGGFLGMVAALVALQWSQTVWWAAAGSFVLGAAGGAAGDLAALMLRLSVLDEARGEERVQEALLDLNDVASGLLPPPDVDSPGAASADRSGPLDTESGPER